MFFLGLFTVLFLLEISLRVTGFIYQKKWALSNKVSSPNGGNSYIVLCLGNSFTLGVGAPFGKRYPDYLQQLLDDKFNKNIIRVINGGVNCENSAELLDKLEANINRLKPDLIILQTGQPNFSNYYKYRNYLRRQNINIKNLPFFLNDFFYNSRIFRLLLLLQDNIKSKNTAKHWHESYQEETYVEFREQLWLNNRQYFSSKEKANEAIAVFKEAIIFDPASPASYDFIGQVYLQQNNYEEALAWFIKAIKVDPGYRDINGENKAYLHIRDMREMNKVGWNKVIDEKINFFIKNFEKTDPYHSSNLMFLTDYEITRWVQSDIHEIIRIIRKNNIKMILQNYPEKEKAIFGLINSILLSTAKDLKVPFVDNALVFQKMQDSGVKIKDYFALDNHCNAKGYKVMAKNVYDKILESFNAAP